jgi:hypothetical protein
MTASELLQHLFVFRADAYARQEPDGRYLSVKEPLTPELLQGHVKGRWCLGAYTVQGKTCIWICWDVDGLHENPDSARDACQALARTCRHFGLAPYVEFSGKKGWHVWVFLEECPAKLARQVGLGIVGEMGPELRDTCSEIAVFPKQTEVTENGFGNLVKLPFGKRADNGKRGRFVHPETLQPLTPAEEVELLSEVVRHLPRELELLVSENGWEFEERLPEPETRSNGFQRRTASGNLPCYEYVSDLSSKAVIGEGHRNNVLFALTNHHKRKGNPEGSALRDILSLNRERCSQPLDEKAVRSTVASAYRSTGSSAGCEILQNAGLCPVLNSGVFCPVYHKKQQNREAESEALNADESRLTITPLRIMRTEPPIYVACVNGRDLQLSLKELMNFPLFKEKCMGSLDFVPKLPHVTFKDEDGKKKQKPPGAVWDDILREASDSIEELPAPPEDVSPRGIAWEEIRTFLTSRGVIDVEDGGSRQDLAFGRVALDRIDGVPYYLFRGGDLRNHLNAAQVEYPIGMVWKLIYDRGGKNGPIKLPNGNLIRVYMIPASSLSLDTELSGPAPLALPLHSQPALGLDDPR